MSFGFCPWGGLRRRGNSSLRHDKGSVYRALAIFHIGTFFKQLCANGPIFTRLLISQTGNRFGSYGIQRQPLLTHRSCLTSTASIPWGASDVSILTPELVAFSRARCNCTWNCIIIVITSSYLSNANFIPTTTQLADQNGMPATIHSGHSHSHLSDISSMRVSSPQYSCTPHIRVLFSFHQSSFFELRSFSYPI
jgi:hypothetical protein